MHFLCLWKGLYESWQRVPNFNSNSAFTVILKEDFYPNININICEAGQETTFPMEMVILSPHLVGGREGRNL